MLTFLILAKAFFSKIFMILTATGRPWYVPDLTSPNPPEPSITSETLIVPFIVIRSGSSPRRSASLLKVIKRARFLRGLRLCPATP